MSGNLAFIEELGIGEPSVENTESQEQEVNQEQSENTDFVQEQESGTETDNNTQENTESSELGELRKMIEGMEKRIADKDEYIEKLRAESKKQSEEAIEDNGVEDSEDDFWDDPVGKYKELQRTMQIQQMQIQETIYANTVEGYWDTVNFKDIKTAAESDSEFAKEINSSKEPYKVAYEYLTAKKQSIVKDQESLREKIRNEERQKILEEMKKGNNKETIPSINKVGSNSGSSNKSIDEDGFASYFGTQY